MRPLVRASIDRHRIPWTFLVLALVASAIQLGWGRRDALLYDRAAILHGEMWRIWTGHFVHFGFAHYVADVGLFVVLGRVLEWRHRRRIRVFLVLTPLLISAGLVLFAPGMTRYGGLSAVNLALLVFLAAEGWQRNWVDWFWPAVLLVYLAEIAFEATLGHGSGGGMIRFDDASARVATAAHVLGGMCALAWSRIGLGCAAFISPSLALQLAPKRMP
jgi:rhomboid family GlyGly-CTERM serine protease